MIWEGKLSSIDEFDKTLKISWQWLSNIVLALSKWLITFHGNYET